VERGLKRGRGGGGKRIEERGGGGGKRIEGASGESFLRT